MSIAEKKAELNRFCKKTKCEGCPLVVTAFCQNEDESDAAVKDAYKTYENSKFRSVKR